MLTVEQIRNLDGKVRQALELIDKLKAENNMLRGKLDEYKERVDQLEGVVDGFKLEQLEIEEGIKDVLKQLDQLEDQITAPEQAGTAGFSAAPAVNNESRAADQQAAQHTDIPKPADAELGISAPPNSSDADDAAQSAESRGESQPPELEIF